MKILRKGDDFVKMNDKTMEDIVKINSMTERGWDYSAKKDYKDSFKVEKTATEAKAEAKKEAEKEAKSEKKEVRKDKKDSKKDSKKKR